MIYQKEVLSILLNDWIQMALQMFTEVGCGHSKGVATYCDQCSYC